MTIAPCALNSIFAFGRRGHGLKSTFAPIVPLASGVLVKSTAPVARAVPANAALNDSASSEVRIAFPVFLLFMRFLPFIGLV